MTEKEKCAQGLLCNANYDQELIDERVKCKDLCHEYNQTKSSDTEKRNERIKQIIQQSKQQFLIELPFLV
ncbi:MAG: maltose acetyltransferase domain-containing protein [Chryseobacterium sp.]